MPYSYILPNGEMIWSLEPMIISTITNHLNISVELIDCNNVFGVRDQNGQWTGSIGKLIRKVRQLSYSSQHYNSSIFDQRRLIWLLAVS